MVLLFSIIAYKSPGRCSEFHIFILLVVSHLTAKNDCVDAVLNFISLETTSSGGFGISPRWGRQPWGGGGAATPTYDFTKFSQSTWNWKNLDHWRGGGVVSRVSSYIRQWLPKFNYILIWFHFLQVRSEPVMGTSRLMCSVSFVHQPQARPMPRALPIISQKGKRMWVSWLSLSP